MASCEFRIYSVIDLKNDGQTGIIIETQHTDKPYILDYLENVMVETAVPGVYNSVQLRYENNDFQKSTVYLNLHDLDFRKYPTSNSNLGCHKHNL